ncbi:MAG: response regulator transcription factor [Myxococcota bacterium]
MTVSEADTCGCVQGAIASELLTDSVEPSKAEEGGASVAISMRTRYPALAPRDTSPQGVADRLRPWLQLASAFSTDGERVNRGAIVAALASASIADRPDGASVAQNIASFVERKRLSRREAQVFACFVADGATNREIASALGIAHPTVKLYWARICRKLDCADAVGAVITFVRESLPGEVPAQTEPESPVTQVLLIETARTYAAKRRLSLRETEVFVGHVAEGKANKEIASDLGIAYPTVRLYWSRICRKLGCSNPLDALIGFAREVIAWEVCCEPHGLVAQR